MSEKSVHCCITSPPYFGLRDYGHEGQIGLEGTPDAYVKKLVEVFREVRRVLRDDGTLWLNLGDTYASNPQGSMGDTGLEGSTAPHADGWFLRQDIIWAKPNPMPESVTDRCIKAHEYIFLLSKSERYYFNSEAMREPATGALPGNRKHKHTASYLNGDERLRTKAGLVEYVQRQRTKALPEGQANIRKARDASRKGEHEDILFTRNRRSVWTVSSKPYRGTHFAVFPPELIRPALLAGCPPEGTVIDPFGGSGTTAQVAIEHGRNAILCELNPAYIPLIHERLDGLQLRIT